MKKEINKLKYTGSTKRIFGIWIMNILLNIITIGLYSFWGKTQIRKYIANHFSIINDHFEYTGKGLELLLGFLKALPIMALLYSPFIMWDAKEAPWINLILIPIWFLIYVGLFSAYKYRVSRLTWRGIRFHITASPIKYAFLSILRVIINILSLGFLIPYSDVKLQKYLFDHLYFGSTKIKFNGNGKKLLLINFITILLVIPTFSLSRFWYKAALTRHIYESISINSIRFKSTQTGGNLLCLFIGNTLILICTLGLGTPIIIQRNMRYFANTTDIIGNIEENVNKTLQSTEKLQKSGEGINTLIGDHEFGFI